MNDSVSSGERTRISPNQLCYGIIGVVGPRYRTYIGEWKTLESVTIEHDSCVHESNIYLLGILSRAEHEKFCMNLPGPSGKAKYSRETDSEPVL